MDTYGKQYLSADTDNVVNGRQHDISSLDSNVIIQDLIRQSVADTDVSNESTKYHTDIKQFQRQEATELKHQQSIKSILNPILICLSVSGCYDFSKFDKDFHKSSGHFKSRLAGIYRKLMLLIIFLGFGKFVVAFFFLSKPDMMPNALCVIWQLMCLSYFLGHLKATSKKYGNQEKVFYQIDNILDSIQLQGIDFPVAQIKRRVLLGTTFGSVIVLINMIGIALQVRFHTQSKNLYTAPFDPTLLTLSLFFSYEFILTLVWIFPLVYNITMCNITKHMFKHYNVYLKASFCETKFAVQRDIQQMRVHHLKLCNLIKSADADMCWFFASVCLFNLGLSCFALYNLVTAPLTQFSLFLYILWLLTSMVSVGLVTISAAVVNEQVSEVIE